MTSVLYDVPGPKAVLRNRILGVVTTLIVLGIFGFVIYRFAATGQFNASKWVVFGSPVVWASIGKALWATVSAFLAAAAGSLLLGFVLAMGRMSDHAWVRVPFTVILELFRAVPVLVMMMLLYYGLPVIGARLEPYLAVVIALIVYNGSVLAEALRAGVESLPRGQKEAGYAIGLRKSGVMWLIQLPQAVRAMLPVIVAQLVVTLKDTALGFIITYPELLYYAKQLSTHSSRPILQAGLVIGAIYIAMCLLLSAAAKMLEIRMRKNPKAGGAHPDPALPAGTAAIRGGGTDTELIGLQDLQKPDPGERT